jgi:hypothetical protein
VRCVRVTVMAGIAMAVLVGRCENAAAGPGGYTSGAGDETGVSAEAGNAGAAGSSGGHGQRPAARGGASGPAPTCSGTRYGGPGSGAIGSAGQVATGSGEVSYEPVNSPSYAEALDRNSGHAAGAGSWSTKWCGGNGNYFGGNVWVPNGAPRRPAVDPAQLARDARDRVPLPAPGIGMNPAPSQDQLVQLATWLWIDGAQWHPVTASASADGVSSTVTATPARVVWNMGDGASVTCAGPGSAYDPAHPDATPPCSYTYKRSSAGQPGSAFKVTATTVWQVTWVASGAAGGGDLGTVQRTSAPVTVRVAEAQAINNG